MANLPSPDFGVQFLTAIIGNAAPTAGDGKNMNQASRFDSVLHSLRDFEASPGKVTCKVTVTPAMQNRNGTLHGGCISTLIPRHLTNFVLWAMTRHICRL